MPEGHLVAGERPRSGLRANALGVGGVTFFVVSAAGPLVAMAGGLPIMMLVGNGAGAPTAFLVVALLLIIFSVGYTAMARHVTNAGAFYAFAARGLGGFAGAAAACIAIVSYTAMQLGLYGLFGAAVRDLAAPLLAVQPPWWCFSLGALAIISALGYSNVDLSVRVLSVLVIGEYLIIFVLDGTILAAGDAHGTGGEAFTPAAALSGSPALALLLCFAAFIGFEATTIYGEEARDPERTIPRATYASVLLIGGFYTFSSWCVVVGTGADNVMPTLRAMPDPSVFVFDLADRYAGGAVSLAMRLLFVTSAFASLLAFHNATSRYLFALGREGLLPASLGRTHEVHQSPHRASVAQSVISLILLMIFVALGADPILVLFAVLSGLGALGIILLMALTSASVLAFFHRHPELGARAGWWRTRILPAVALVCLLAMSVLGGWRFDVLSSHEDAFTRLLPLTLVVAAAAGIAAGWRLRSADPAGFRSLGRTRS